MCWRLRRVCNANLWNHHTSIILLRFLSCYTSNAHPLFKNRYHRPVANALTHQARCWYLETLPSLFRDSQLDTVHNNLCLPKKAIYVLWFGDLSSVLRIAAEFFYRMQVKYISDRWSIVSSVVKWEVVWHGRLKLLTCAEQKFFKKLINTPVTWLCSRPFKYFWERFWGVCLFDAFVSFTKYSNNKKQIYFSAMKLKRPEWYFDVKNVAILSFLYYIILTRTETEFLTSKFPASRTLKNIASIMVAVICTDFWNVNRKFRK